MSLGRSNWNWMMVLWVSAATLSACSRGAPQPPAATAPSLPQSWYGLPEDKDATVVAAADPYVEPPAQVAEGLDDTLDAQKEVLEDAFGTGPGGETAFGLGGMAVLPPGFVPWRLAAFMTDLSVSASGVLGSLTVKGTPALSLFWRKRAANAASAAEPLDAVAEISVAADLSPAERNNELESAVRAAMATGRVHDESRFRGELGRLVADFAELARGLDASPAGQQWWVSRVRMDVSVDASGKVAFLASLGAEVRLRLEWHRVMKTGTALPSPIAAAQATGKSEAQRSFDELVRAVSSDLRVLTPQGSSLDHGYQPYVFRVGVGMTAGGTFGIAKSNVTTTGQVYFSRDVPKPKARIMSEVNEGLDQDTGETVAFIDADPLPAHLEYAEAHGIESVRDGSFGGLERVIYRVNRARLRKGLARAERMAGFFARHAQRIRTGSWGIHELRASFDMSLSGKLSTSTVGGLATSEIALYNEEFGK